MRYDRMSGLDSEQLDELVRRIKDQLEEPWRKGIGRPKDLSLREAVVVACGYMRQNITQEVWAEIFDTSQPVISGIIAKFTPLIEASTEEDRPTVDEAKEAAAREQTVLVDGFLAPTWSWRDTPELWSGKHKTTGFNGQAIANLRGDLLFVSEPVTGHNHDMTALAETETADIIAAAYSGIGDKGYQGSDFITPFKKPQGGELLDWQKEFNAQVNKLRAPVERAIAHLKSWRILHTDYRRPLRTYVTSYRAAVGLYFFKLNFGSRNWCITRATIPRCSALSASRREELLARLLSDGRAELVQSAYPGEVAARIRLLCGVNAFHHGDLSLARKYAEKLLGKHVVREDQALPAQGWGKLRASWQIASPSGRSKGEGLARSMGVCRTTVVWAAPAVRAARPGDADFLHRRNAAAAYGACRYTSRAGRDAGRLLRSRLLAAPWGPGIPRIRQRGDSSQQPGHARWRQPARARRAG